MREGGLPNFLVIGAAKAGTTSLYRYLRQHPEVFMAQVKEPAFFSNDHLYSKGVDWYRRTFFHRAGEATAVGEATPHYFCNTKVIDRIARDLPASSRRFILVLRDPVARAYSMYWTRVRGGVEAGSFEQALDLETERLQDPEVFREGSITAGYRFVGDYATHLSAWRDAFGPGAILVLLQEDLHDQPVATMQRVCAFLDISEDAEINVAVKHNPSSTVRYPRLRQLWRTWHRMPTWTRAPLNMLPERTRRRLLQTLVEANKRPWRYPPLSERTEQQLRASFEPSISRLEELLERDLSGWKLASARGSPATRSGDG